MEQVQPSTANSSNVGVASIVGSISASTGNASSSTSKDILSERVQRALSIRTDTTAMKTAFDALQQTQQMQFTDESKDDTNRNSGNQLGIVQTALLSSRTSEATIDSRSVRTIMEYDTYQQALLVQDSIASMLLLVQELRHNCTNVVETARKIRSTIHTSTTAVASSSSSSTTDPSTEALTGTLSAAPSLTGVSSSLSKENNNDKNSEYQLAVTLSNAMQQRNTISLRIQTLQSFISQYHLSDHDIHLLEHYNFAMGNNDEGMAFLRALQRIREIRTALQKEFGHSSKGSAGASTGSTTDDLFTSSLLATTGNTSSNPATATTATTAFHLMEQLSVQQEQAYERLYHWLQQYLQQSSSSSSSNQAGNDQITIATTTTAPGSTYSLDFIFCAIQILKHVPPFYNHCIELMSQQRRTIVTRNFLIALTVGNSHVGTTGDANHYLHLDDLSSSYNDHLPQQPIEMKSHDSVAYVGDMLTFAFKSFTLEVDLTKNILRYQMSQLNDDDEENYDDEKDNGSGMDELLHSSLQDHTNADDNLSEEKALSGMDMISISMSGIVRPLKSRILQVIATLCRRTDDATIDAGDGTKYDNENDGFYGTSGIGGNVLDQEDDGSQIRSRVGQLYDICGLLLFYHATILRGVKKIDQQQNHQSITAIDANDTSATETREINPLLDCILECFLEATQGYEATVRVYCAMVDQIALLTGDSIATLMQKLIVLLIQSRINSPGYLRDITQVCPNQTCIETLSIEWVMEILINTCFNIPTLTIDDIMTVKESFYVTKHDSNIEFNQDKAMKLDALIIEKEMTTMNELVNIETLNVFDLCGLRTVVNGWNDFKETTTISSPLSPMDISSHPGLTAHEIETSIKEFYVSLYSPPIPALETVIYDPIVRKQVRAKIANNIVSFYHELYNVIQTDPSYSSIRHVLQHSPQEVQSLFTV